MGHFRFSTPNNVEPGFEYIYSANSNECAVRQHANYQLPGDKRKKGQEKKSRARGTRKKDEKSRHGIDGVAAIGDVNPGRYFFFAVYFPTASRFYGDKISPSVGRANFLRVSHLGTLRTTMAAPR